MHTGEPTAIGASDRALEAGDVVGEYVIDAVLGKGGFGTVYRATHPVIGKQVAIKVLARRPSCSTSQIVPPPRACASHPMCPEPRGARR